MSKNRQRTGIFDLDGVKSINLSSNKKVENEFTNEIINPKILVDATDLKNDNLELLHKIQNLFDSIVKY